MTISVIIKNDDKLPTRAVQVQKGTNIPTVIKAGEEQSFHIHKGDGGNLVVSEIDVPEAGEETEKKAA